MSSSLFGFKPRNTTVRGMTAHGIGVACRMAEK
jgi:hypothetical protein